VLTRNQLLEIVRWHEDSDFKAVLQRLSNAVGRYVAARAGHSRHGQIPAAQSAVILR
jgi:hypothetical protein